jgi:hypothetical protein
VYYYLLEIDTASVNRDQGQGEETAPALALQRWNAPAIYGFPTKPSVFPAEST